MEPDSKSSLILDFHRMGIIKFGQFKLKSGAESPIYIDLRLSISSPKLMVQICDLICQKLLSTPKLHADYICGIPYAAIPYTTCASIKANLPMLLCRKEPKAHGTKQILEGSFQPGESCVLIEDVITSGSSLGDVAELLRGEGLKVNGALVLIDRDQGGPAMLRAKYNINVFSLFTLPEILEILLSNDVISEKQSTTVNGYLKQSIMSKPPPTVARLKFFNSLYERLSKIIETKDTQLCVAIDTSDPRRLLQLADKVGPKICALKVHLEFLVLDNDDNGMTPADLRNQLMALAQRHDFLIVQDSKLSDIGQTTYSQLCDGMFHLADWCDLVTVHGLPGPGLFAALRRINEARDGHAIGALLVTEMSCEGNLTDPSYRFKCLQLARSNADVIHGFVAQHQIIEGEFARAFQWIPGVRIDSKGDKLGQKYNDPVHVRRRFSTECHPNVILIVGRGITEADDVTAAAEVYRVASV